MIKTTVMPNCYMDSILILSVSRELMKLPGVRKAVAVMATDMNKTVVDEFGGTTPAVAAAGANDLIISLDCEDEGVMSAAEDKVRAQPPSSNTAASQRPRRRSPRQTSAPSPCPANMRGRRRAQRWQMI